MDIYQKVTCVHTFWTKSFGLHFSQIPGKSNNYTRWIIQGQVISKFFWTVKCISIGNTDCCHGHFYCRFSCDGHVCVPKLSSGSFNTGFPFVWNKTNQTTVVINWEEIENYRGTFYTRLNAAKGTEIALSFTKNKNNSFFRSEIISLVPQTMWS